MTIELIRADELRLVANGPGKQGRIGVVYQVTPTGEMYRWDGSKHSPVSGDGVAVPADAWGAVLDEVTPAEIAGVWAGGRTWRRAGWDNSEGVTRITGSVWYVSNLAAAGWALGNDANAGTSRAAPKLTIASAVTAARDGDTVIVNASTTPYDLGAGLTLGRRCTILPTAYRGVVLRSSNANAPINVGTDDVTLGAVVVDATLTTSGLAVSAIRSTGQRRNLRLIGTELRGNTNALLLLGTVRAYGVSCVSLGATRALVSVTAGVAGPVIFDRCTIDGRVFVRPSVAGVPFALTRSAVRGFAASGTYPLVDVVGASSVTVEDNELTCDGTPDPIGVWVVPHATLPCTLVSVRRNRISLGVSSAAVGGYGVGIGGENPSAANNIDETIVDENDIAHANHGLFIAYGCKNGRARRNVVRDTVIGLIRKGFGAAGGSVDMSSNVVIGGVLTGGALRAKENSASQPTTYRNNTVIFDAASDVGGQHILATDDARGVSFVSNILHAAGISVKTCVAVTDTSAATFGGNNYFAASFETGAWVTPAFAASNVFAAWQSSAEPTARNVDPAFVSVADGDYRLSATSPLAAAAVSPADTDFDAQPLGQAVGAMRVAT